MTSVRLLVLIALLGMSSHVLAQEALQPIPMVDPLKDVRVKERDAWKSLVQDARKQEDSASLLVGAWALFHQYDLDYFSLLEGDGKPLLADYERRCRDGRMQLVGRSDATARLTLAELSAVLYDIDANRLQNERPDDGTAELAAWNTKFDRFQAARAQELQDRGKRLTTMYRQGSVDDIRLCTALLERQIAERNLLEHRELSAAAEQGKEERFRAQRKALLEKQRDEWEQLQDVLEEGPAKPLYGEKIGALHRQTLDLLIARLASSPDKAAQGEQAALVKSLFAAYQSLHRYGVELHLTGKTSIEQLARLHDLRMYTTLWSDPALAPADVVADAMEVAETWGKLYERLAKEKPGSLEAQIALAKKLGAEISRDERKGVTPAK